MKGTPDKDSSGVERLLGNFADTAFVNDYAEGVRRFVPGVDALHRMAALLLAERVPSDAQILVLGAGGGMELKALATAAPGWRFVGVDPAPAMLDLARRTLGAATDRTDLIEGYVDDAPAGPFHGATCLLTLHFLTPDERGRTLRAIRDRLRPGAPLIVAHGSFAQDAPERGRWLDRYAAYALASGAPADRVAEARTSVEASDTMLSPGEDEAILRDAGFRDVAQFYAAFTWRGWVAYA